MAMYYNIEVLKYSDLCCPDHVDDMQNIYYSIIKECDEPARMYALH